MREVPCEWTVLSNSWGVPVCRCGATWVVLHEGKYFRLCERHGVDLARVKVTA